MSFNRVYDSVKIYQNTFINICIVASMLQLAIQELRYQTDNLHIGRNLGQNLLYANFKQSKHCYESIFRKK